MKILHLFFCHKIFIFVIDHYNIGTYSHKISNKNSTRKDSSFLTIFFGWQRRLQGRWSTKRRRRANVNIWGPLCALCALCAGNWYICWKITDVCPSDCISTTRGVRKTKKFSNYGPISSCFDKRVATMLFDCCSKLFWLNKVPLVFHQIHLDQCNSSSLLVL